jgi:quercetin dioxygenase-like cupin family protein
MTATTDKSIDELYPSLKDLSPYAVWPGSNVRALNLSKLQIAIAEVAANIKIPEHHHTHEQISLITSGVVTYIIDGKKQELHAGDFALIPSDVLHSAFTGDEGAIIIDIFTPVRDDWESLNRIPPQEPLWP